MQSLLLLAQNDGGAVAVGGGIVMMLVFLVIGLGGFVLWLWALIDAIRNPALDSTMRLVWVLVILFTNLLGAIIYLIVGRSPRTTTPPG